MYRVFWVGLEGASGQVWRVAVSGLLRVKGLKVWLGNKVQRLQVTEAQASNPVVRGPENQNQIKLGSL